MSKVDTLCWHCANATGKCSWSHRLHPVEGWTAIEEKILVETGSKRNRYFKPITAYKVQDCPQYRRG
jgi:hypothetical protein